MDKDFFRRIAIDMRESGVEELGLFFLGESFILRDLAEYVRIAKHEAGFPYVFLTTNGLDSTPRKVQEVMEAGLDSLKFSMNWADAKQFEEVTGLPARLFAKVVSNIKGAEQARNAAQSNCGLYASYIEFDGDQKEKMQKLVDEVSPFLDEVYQLPLYNQGGFTTEDVENRNLKPTAGNMGRVGALRDPLPCWAVMTEGHVSWDGDLSACCFSHDHRFTMGSLKEQSFMEAWNSEKFQELRKAHLAKDVTGTVCEKCVAYC